VAGIISALALLVKQAAHPQTAMASDLKATEPVGH
jgi:AAHS family 4-hydroxybenzoate transporter-like MFS transporter